MFDINRGQDDRILHVVTGHVNAAQAKWGRLTPADLSGIHTRDQLVAKVHERYGVSHQQAADDVERWVSDKQF